MTWREIDMDGARIRYRETDADTARRASRVEVERWHERPGEWRPLVNWSSREWFALGLAAGRQEGGAL